MEQKMASDSIWDSETIDNIDESILSMFSVSKEQLEKLRSPLKFGGDSPVINELINHLNSGGNALLSGGAGVGKSFRIKEIIQNNPSRLNVTATTGIASVNINGITIHRLLELGIAESPDSYINIVKSYLSDVPKKNIAFIVIDEVSMLKAGQLDLINLVLMELHQDFETPFGGVRIIISGDIMQLKPVFPDGAPEGYSFFFESDIYNKGNFKTFELTKVMRQDNPEFISFLNKVRLGNFDEECETYIKRFTPTKSSFEYAVDGYTVLCARNSEAKKVNEHCIKLLKGKMAVFEGFLSGHNKKAMRDVIDNSMTEKTLNLKIGSKIMFIRNAQGFGDDKPDANYVNGETGVILGSEVKVIKRKKMKELNSTDDWYAHMNKSVVDPFTGLEYSNNDLEDPLRQCYSIKLLIKKDNGDIITLGKVTWEEKSTYKYNPKSKSMEWDAVFSQFPIKLAYGITIHKSQGLSLPKVCVLCAKIVEDNQFYVAVSRATNPDNLVLFDFDRSCVKTCQKSLNFLKQSTTIIDGGINEKNISV